MKIVVANPSGAYYCKPDNTLNHNNSDYYYPEGVALLEVVPCIYTHIDKAGKCVAPRFAGRYFSAWAFGMLLVDCSSGASAPVAASMDFTSVMDMAWNRLDSLAEGGCTIEINGQQTFCLGANPGASQFADAICNITKRTSLRIGDIVAIELGSAAQVRPGDTVTRTVAGKSTSIKIY